MRKFAHFALNSVNIAIKWPFCELCSLLFPYFLQIKGARLAIVYVCVCVCKCTRLMSDMSHDESGEFVRKVYIGSVTKIKHK